MASYQSSSADSTGEIRDTGSSFYLSETVVDKKSCLITRSNSVVRYDQLHGFLQWLLQSARTKRPDAEAVESIANALIDVYSQVLSQEVENYTVRQTPKSIFHCFACGCLFVEPVTLACGHTLCKACVESGADYKRSIHCQQCGLIHETDPPSVNVLIANLLQKCFPNEYEAEVKQLKELLPDLYSGSPWKILDSLSNFLKYVPNHVIALKWRSDAFAQRGLYGEALEDIEKACQIRPCLSSVFHRKGLLLKTINEHHEAVLCFSRSAALQPRNAAYRSELAFSLTKILSLQNARIEHGHNPVVLTQKETYKAPSSYSQDSSNAQPGPVKTPKQAALGHRKRQTESDEKNDLDRESALCVDSAGLGKSSGSKRPAVSDDSSLSPYISQAHSSRLKTQSLPTVKRIKLQHFQTTIRDLKYDFANDEEDMDCKVCYNVLFQPVTTFCGHTFCRECLLRCLDHRSVCPCCRQELNCSVEISRKVTTEVEEIAKQLFRSEYAQREKSFTEEKQRWIRVGVDEDVEVPIFVCMLVFPSLCYPLHIFEPRHRLMTRQCIELGTRMFGICPPDDDTDKEFADFGTMVHIEKLNVLPDGRSIIQTKAGRRFRVICRGLKNGYNTAKIEWLSDEHPTDRDQIKELKVINADCRKLLELWYNSLSELQRTCITNAIGPLPKLDESVLLAPNGPAWVWWALAAVPLLDKAKLAILKMTSLNERLQSIRRFLEVMLNVIYGNN